MKPPVPALFRSIAEYTYDWETWVDADGVVRWINPAVGRITGYTVDEALTREPLSLAHEEDRPLLARVLADARAGGSGNDVEFRVRCKDGSLRWVAMSWQALHDEGQRLGYRTSVRDIEQRKQIEAELHVMRRRAEASAAARTQLLANVSHELRSPVHCIAGFAEVLLESTLSAEQRRYLELIARECSGMSRHVDDLLQLAAIEAGGARLTPRAFELSELVKGVVEAARPHTRGLSLELTHPGETWLLGDPLRIGQVLRNLLDNALKFTSEGGVRVAVKASGRDPKHVELVVSDTGSGIDPAQVERLLAPFEQASDSRAQGVGLGLSIVQRLVSSMRGTLEIDGKLAEGTTVRVMLPLAVAQREQPTPVTRAPHKARKGASALIVDDSAAARELLSVVLTRAGYRVIEASSSKQALVRFAETPCSLVLLDYQLPDADGIETALGLRRVAAAAELKELRIYLVTANVFARGQVEKSRAAIDGVLEKPVGRADLLGLIGASRTASDVLDRDVVSDLRDAGVFEKVLAGTKRELELELAVLASAQQPDEVARSAHRVAGIAAVVGARVVAELARALEDGADADGAVPRLRAAWTDAEQALLQA